MATDESAGAALVTETVLQGILALALGFGLLNGYDWARRLYLWASPIFVMLALVLGKTSAELPGQWPMFSVALVAYAVWAYFLTRPKAVAFFHKQSRKPVTV